MGYILIYLLIRIYEGKTIEITETVSDSNSFIDNRLEHPFDDTKFIIAYDLHIAASNYNWVYESTSASLYQYEAYRNQSGEYLRKTDYYFPELCNSTHFSEKDFEDIPGLNRMNWLSSNFSLTGSAFSK